MELAPILTWLDLFSVAVCAASGALSAAKKRLDIGGFVLVCAAAGIGGGTIRDLLLGYSPVFWVKRPEYVAVCLAAALLLFASVDRIERRGQWLLWADAVGLGLYTVVGAEKALAIGASGLIAVATGIVTATFGGVLRDILCNEVPLILKKEVYATASAAGALAYVGLHEWGIERNLALLAAGGLAFAIRGAGIAFSWSLPNYGGKPD